MSASAMQGSHNNRNPAKSNLDTVL